MIYIPNTQEIADFVESEIKYDRYVKQSYEERYMTKDGLIVAEFINHYCNMNCPKVDGGMREQGEAWKAQLPEAYKLAAKELNTSPEKAEELFTKSLSLRSRCINR